MINRLIIIGNGFDIAHGLKTKYSDFVENYYSSIKHSSLWNDEFYECKITGFDFNNYTKYSEIIKYLTDSNGGTTPIIIKGNNPTNYQRCIKIKNEFFNTISKSHSIQNWVDIENEYFKAVLSIIDIARKSTNTSKNQDEAIFRQIAQLNNDLDGIAQKFEEYLKTHVTPKITDKKNKLLDHILYNKNRNEGDILNDFIREFPKKYEGELIGEYNKNNGGYKFRQTIVLNFNYTNTFEYLYRNSTDKYEYINIHGQIHNPNNKINMGFGDEMSNRYSEIEDLNNNECLRLMKSFAYTENSNYKRLTDFIDSAPFQVKIMGHSCGTSDRTLLNAIFENNNCKSIKVYYHQGENHDNYSDIIRNISRHFNKKTMMRDKIVNKEYCTPLPQFDKI